MNRYAVIGLVAVLATASAAVAAPLDIILTDTYGGHTYHLLAAGGGNWWLDFEAEAVNLGGHLVTVDDAAENAFLASTFFDFADTYADTHGLRPTSSWNVVVCIGLSDHVSEGNYQWISGDPLVYINWAGGQPSHAAAHEDFVGYFGSGGGWHDFAGSNVWKDIPFGLVEIVPEPATLGLLAVSGACLLRRKRV